MQSKPRTRLIVSLLCLLTLAAVWGWLQRQPSIAPSTDATSAGTPGTQPAAAIPPAPAPLLSGLRPGDAIPAPSPAPTNANGEPFAYRLRNTPRALDDLMRDDAALLLRNALIDTRQPLNLGIPAHLRADAEPGAYVVQSRSALNDGFRKQLTDAGATVVSYVPNNALLVRVSAETAQRLAALPETLSVLPWEPYYKLDPRLLTAAVEQRFLPRRAVFNVLVFAGDRDAAAQSLTALGAQVAAEDRSPFGTHLTVFASETALVPMAKLPTVQAIEPHTQRRPANDLTRARVKISTNTVTAQNYLGLTGAGVRVGVNDTGVDQTHVDLLTRVTALNPALLQDRQGHGTHVAGIIASSGQNGPDGSKGPVPGSITNANYRGMAPEAGIFALPIDSIFGLLAGDTYLQEATALTNIFISNNSWGYQGTNDYDFAAASWDEAVRDAVPGVSGPQPLVAVFAAGNMGFGGAAGTGGRSGSITSPGTAKNVITVGAMENYRRITNEVTGGSDPGASWFGITDSSNQVAGFSSRGNVGRGQEGPFGRFKPDLVAPGTMVVSTRSSQWTDPVGETQVELGTVSDQILRPQTTNDDYVVFVPQNTVQLIIEAVPNRFSPNPFPALPIFAAANQRPGPGDQVGVTQAIIANPVSGAWFYSVVNPTDVEVRFDLRTILVVTNDPGDLYTVLKNLNDVLAPNYRYESGSSQSAPVISGMLALMQQHFEQTLGVTNSPALMKALLINGARTASANNPAYDFAVRNYLNYQGWGLPNITNTLPASLDTGDSANGAMVYFDQDPARALATGQSFTRNVTVATTGINSPLRFTLVWTDPPGYPLVGIKLVNDLDLIVTNLTTGEVYAGNAIESGNLFNTAVTNGEPVFDLVNNVENVFIDRPLSGATYSVTVRARRVNVNAVNIQTNGTQQDFALVVSSGNPGTQLRVSVTAPTAGWEGNAVVKSVINGRAVLNERVGANSPLLSSTNGITNQWNFYIVTNKIEGTNGLIASNIAFATFLPPNLSRPRYFSADIDLYVSANPALTNLDTAVISSSYRSLNRGGTEMVVLSNVANIDLFYAAVKSEDQQAASYGFFAVSSQDPFSSRDEDGNIVLQGYPVGALIPDGDAAEPGGTNIIAFCTESAVIQNVTVENTLTMFDTDVGQEYGGDLFGVLTHQDPDTQAEPYAVLNNHRAFYGTQTWIYDESDDGEIPNAIPPDGPGSLRDFAGDEALGIWQFTVTDNALEYTGRVDSIEITVQPQPEELLDGTGIRVTIQPGAWKRYTVDVPPNATNLMVCVAPEGGPLDVYLRFEADPTLTQYDVFQRIEPPGDCVNLGRRDSPPLTTGRYHIGLFNPGTAPVVANVKVFVQRGAVANSTFTFRSSGSVNLLDDAVTNSTIFVNQVREVADLSVGVRIDHDRVSDLVLHLISPSGTRVLLAENRGGPYGTNYGAGVLETNVYPATSSGGPAANTNSILVPSREGTLEIAYEFYGVPDYLHVYYDDQLIFDSGLVSGSGVFTVDFGPGFATNVVIVMNEGDNANTGTLWAYTATVFSGIYYANFTENQQLSPVPIKFAVPPFAPTNTATTTNIYAVSDFETAPAGVYTNGSTFEGWTVTRNTVEVTNDPPTAYSGSQYLALKSGIVERFLPTRLGGKYQLHFAHRGTGTSPCLVSLWSAETNALDSVGANNGTPVGAVRYIQGQIGQGFSLSNNAYVRVPRSASLDVGQGNGFSVVAWIAPTTVANWMPIVEWADGSNPALTGAHFWISVGSPGSLYANLVDSSGNPHIVTTGPNIVSANSFQHVALTYNRISGMCVLYRNGVAVAQANLGTSFVADTAADMLIGSRQTGSLNYFTGAIDETALYQCALSPAEVKASYDAGVAGTSSGNQDAQFALSIDGNSSILTAGATWNTEIVPFIAGSTSVVLSVAGITNGAFVDRFELFELVSPEVYYLAEESLSPFIGEQASGLWRLEVWDNRAGGTATNASLLSWKLNLTFANTNYAVTPLTNCTPYNNAVEYRDIAYFKFNVPLSARYVTNHLTGSDVLDLLFSYNGPPQGNQPGDVALFNNVTDAIAVIATNGTLYLDNAGNVLGSAANPRLVPGRSYYLGVRHNNAGAAARIDYQLTVCADRVDPNLGAITVLTNGVTNCVSSIAADAMAYFAFDVVTQAVSVQFGLVANPPGNLDLYVSKGLPVPTTNYFTAASTNPGNAAEWIDVTDQSTYTLGPARWYVGVLNREPNPVAYCLYATQVVSRIIGFPGSLAAAGFSALGAAPGDGITNQVSVTANPGEVIYFPINIRNNTQTAWFETFGTGGNVDLFVRPDAAGPLLPAGTAPTNAWYLSMNASANEFIAVSNNATANALVPGTWLIGVVNLESAPVPYTVRVTQFTNELPGTIVLTNFAAHPDTVTASNLVDYYQFTVRSNPVQVVFETFNADGDVDLHVRPFSNVPLPGPGNFALASTNSGAANEYIVTLPWFTDAPASPGIWYLAVTRRSGGAVNYNIRARAYYEEDFVALTNGIAYPTTLVASNSPTSFGFNYYRFEVSSHAFQARFETFGTTNNLTLLAQKGLPLTNENAFTYQTNLPLQGTRVIDVLTNSTPVKLGPGVWYMAVFNPNPFAVPYSARVTEITPNQIVRLTNALAYSNAIAPQLTTRLSGIDYYVFTVSTGAFQTTFETTNATGNVDLYVTRGLPIPGIAGFPLASTNPGTSEEMILVLPGSTPALTPGDWYLAVVNRELTNVSYAVRATEWTTNSMVTLTNAIAYELDTLVPGPTTEFYRYVVASNALQANFQLDALTGRADLYLRKGPPLTNVLSWPLSITNSGTNDEWIVLNPGSTPVPLTPGDWYLAVVNLETNSIHYRVTASEILPPQLTTLPIGALHTTNVTPASPVFSLGRDFYVFNVSTGAIQMDCQVFVAGGDVDLYVSRRLPLPGTPGGDYVSLNSGPVDEYVQLTTNSSPVALAPGNWYLTVVNREPGLTPYSVRVVEVDQSRINRLTNGIVHATMLAPPNIGVPYSGVDFHVFNVSSNAVQATFETVQQAGNVDIYVRQSLPLPGPTNYFHAGTNNAGLLEWIPVTTNSTPFPLTPGDWFVAVVNRESFPVPYWLRATEVLASQIVSLTNGVAFTNTAAASPTPLQLSADYYVFNVSSGAVQTVFETLGASNNVDLYLHYQLPLPGAAHFDFASAAPGSTNEWLLLTNGSAPVSLTNGPWYLAVVNRETTPTSYAVRATEVTASQIIRLTNAVAFSNTVSLASNSIAGGVNYYVFNVSTGAFAATFESYRATGNIDLYLRRGLPVPGATFFDYAGTNAGNAREVIVVATNSTPIPLSSGDWYLAVVNRATNAAAYSVRATETRSLTNVTTLTNAIRVFSTVPAGDGSFSGGTRYFSFNITTNAIAASFQLYPLFGNVDLFIRRGLPLPTEYDYSYASTNARTTNDVIDVTTNSVPYPLQAGIWYLAVVNRETNASTFSVQVNEYGPPITPLTNGIPYAATLTASTNHTKDFYVFNVSTNARRAQFEVLQPTGDVYLAVRKGLPLPDEADHDYKSDHMGTNAELIVVTRSSAPVPLSPGNWYITVSRTSAGPVSYRVKATEYASAGTNLLITRAVMVTNNLCLTWTNSLPGVNYHVEGRISLDNTNWMPVSPTLTATASQMTWCLPLPSQFHFFRIAEGLVLTPAAPPQIPIGNISMTAGAFRLEWTGPTNQIYRAEWTATLAPGSWLPFPGLITSSNGVFVFLDDGSQTGGLEPKRFYRFILLP